MITEKYQWLAAVIAAHPDRTLVGRTRLQKTVRLLQRIGAPVDYSYRMHHYGPYSEGVQSDIGLVEQVGLVNEERSMASDGSPYYRFTASDQAAAWAASSEVAEFEEQIRLMSEAEATVLELAATYDSFREAGQDHDAAIKSLRHMKGEKCESGAEEQAMELLRKLDLPSS